MLIENFKKSFNKWFIILFVGLMCFVFIFVGVFPSASEMITGGSTVASVGGEPISTADFQRVMNREMEAYKAFGDQLPPFFMQQIQERALQSLVQQKLLLKESQRLGVFVSNKEVMKEIQAQSFFQNEETKAFDVERYKQVLASNGLTPGVYEHMVQEDLMRGRLVQFFQSRIRVTDAEVKREFELAGEKRNLEFIRIRNEDAFPKMTLKPEEITAFLADPAKKGLIESQYTANVRKYKRDEEVCARHILVRSEEAAPVEGEAPKESTSASKPPAKFTKLNPTSANFASLASKNSDDPGSKEKGGDLGCFPRGMMDEAFEKTAFSLPVGKVSEPVKSQFGWHYILVYEKKAPFERKLADAEREIAVDLLKKDRISEVQKINRATAEEYSKRWSAGDRKGLGITETGLFTRVQGSIPSIGRATEIMSAAFDENATIQKAPQIFEAAGGVIVARVKERQSADFSKFEAEKAKQLQTLQSRKLEAFFPAWIENVQKQFPVKFNKAALDRFAPQQAL